MPRANLSALLGNIDEPKPTLPAAPPSTPQPRTAESTKSVARGVPAPYGPLYLRLVRKEARLREEQYAELTRHARRLSRARGAGGSRITENTLIRVAVDLLLAKIDAASGADEDALRESLR